MKPHTTSRTTHFSAARTRALTITALILGAGWAQAHPGTGPHAHGFAPGIIHPLSGWDHLCAMIAVGIYAAQRGGKARWMLPLTFLGCMTLGGLTGLDRSPIPGLEQALAASVLVLGLLVALAARLPLLASVPLIAVFAWFHGFAHGAEMGSGADSLNYCLGFLVATGLLHTVGYGLGTLSQRIHWQPVVRLTGGAMAAFGLYLSLA